MCCACFSVDGENITSSESESAYNGQIHIDEVENLHGDSIPHIKLDEKIRPLCIDIISDTATLTIVGRSICRQLDYTDVHSTDPVV